MELSVLNFPDRAMVKKTKGQMPGMYWDFSSKPIRPKKNK